MIDSLVGRPTAEVLPFICQQNRGIAGLYLTAYEHHEMSDGEVETPLLVPKQLVFESDWVEKHKRERGLPYVGLASYVAASLHGLKGMHLPMMDYDFGSGLEDIEQLSLVLDRLYYPEGVIINSGRGLHYLGFSLWSDEILKRSDIFYKRISREMSDGNDDLYEDGLDVRWLVASEQRGFQVLRLNNGVEKPIIPTVVGIYRPENKYFRPRRSINMCAINLDKVIQNWAVNG